MILAFIFGLSYGSFEISCNLYASNLEKREKKSMMSGFHAFWSLGVLLGSIATSLFLEWEISLLNNVIIYILILLPFNILIVLKLEGDQIEIFLRDTSSPALIKDPSDFDSIYVVMPMKG